MSEKSFSVASSPLIEMCIAICQSASDHYLPGCMNLQSVYTELLVKGSWK